jgi:hypothetical protein
VFKGQKGSERFPRVDLEPANLVDLFGDFLVKMGVGGGGVREGGVSVPLSFHRPLLKLVFVVAFMLGHIFDHALARDFMGLVDPDFPAIETGLPAGYGIASGGLGISEALRLLSIELFRIGLMGARFGGEAGPEILFEVFTANGEILENGFEARD